MPPIENKLPANVRRGQNRTNFKQKHILFAAMAMNRKILEGRSGDSDARRARKEVWKKIVVELNKAGFKKSVSQWRKVYTDLRLAMRKKWTKHKRGQYKLNEYERRVIDACGMLENEEQIKSYQPNPRQISIFLTFLENEAKKEISTRTPYFENYTEYNSSDDNSDPSQYVICQSSPTAPTFENEIKEEIYDDDDEDDYILERLPSKSEDFIEPTVECISDDEILETKIKIEIPDSPLPEQFYVNEEPMPTGDTITEQSFDHKSTENDNQLPMPESIQIQTPMVNVNKFLRKKKVQNATLKEIKKMHRNLLKESKKQTMLLRKLVQAMKK